MKSILRLCLTVVVSAVCGLPAAADSNPSVAGIDDINSRWQEAVNRRTDNGELRALYTDGAIIVPPGQDILTEKNVSDFINAQIRAYMDDFRIQPINLRVEGDKAYQSAVWIANLTGDAAGANIDGIVTSVFQRQADGSWKIRFQSWN